MKSKTKNTTRRDFIKKSAIALTAFTIVPRHVLGGRGFIAPSDKVNIGMVGCGGMANNTIRG
ncbi:MAG: twin-arginine translocation signal domain-containing protein, partial [Bacteroidales bacterium]|nr:twin-arginine translocation signal domain-containing protein [Bacteroidales bacterium]